MNQIPVTSFKADFTLKDFLFEAATLIKNADPDKYSCSKNGIAYDACSSSLLANGEFVKNVIIFCVANKSSAHVENRKRDNLAFGESSAQGLDQKTITAKAK